ncbi:MAG TPA: hypothetical protein VEV43_14290, partial [Actinomycetota bacterium]|nr:hypothetical protein [Actinomycetota bacterium]
MRKIFTTTPNRHESKPSGTRTLPRAVPSSSRSFTTRSWTASGCDPPGGSGLGDGDGSAGGVGSTEVSGLGVGEGVGDGDGLGDGVGEGEGDGDEAGEGLGFGDGVGLGAGDGLGEAEGGAAPSAHRDSGNDATSTTVRHAFTRPPDTVLPRYAGASTAPSTSARATVTGEASGCALHASAAAPATCGAAI